MVREKEERRPRKREKASSHFYNLKTKKNSVSPAFNPPSPKWIG